MLTKEVCLLACLLDSSAGSSFMDCEMRAANKKEIVDKECAGKHESALLSFIAYIVQLTVMISHNNY